MEPQTRTSAKDFFINLGAIVALYTSVASLVSLLFTVINTAYPKTINYGYLGSASISWPVATLIIAFPIFLLLMWLLGKDYKIFPEKQNSGIHRWLTYITLFLAGLTIAIDLITVLYYFLDGQELTTGFVLKILILLVIAGAIFSYYLSDVLGKLTSKSRMAYRIIALVFILGSIAWGFSVLGSPQTQRLYKYDEQKVMDLQNINGQINSYYSMKGALPKTLEEMGSGYYIPFVDSQNGKAYEYKKTGNLAYELCTDFNKDSREKDNASIARPMWDISWTHPAGYHCFSLNVSSDMYTKPAGIPVPF